MLHRYPRQVVRRNVLALCLLTTIIFFTLSLWNGRVHADAQVTYYVSPTGSDSNSGTDSNHPFATIAHAHNVVETVNGSMTGNIVVYLMNGTYTQSSTLAFAAADSGTNGYNVIYQAYPGAQPVISGGVQITGWSQVSGTNIWQASVPAGLQTRQLFVNGVRATRARSTGGLPGAVQTSTGYTTTDTTMQNWGNPSNIEFVYQNQWIQPRCDVSSISGTTITMKEPCFNNSTTGSRPGVTISTPLYIENAYELLSQPGQWYLNQAAANGHPANTVYYIPRSGENMATATVIAPTLQTIVSGTGTLSSPIHNIEFYGLTFSYGTWLQPDSNDGFSEVQANTTVTTAHPLGGTPYNSFSVTPANVAFNAAHNITFERNTFTHLGAAGLSFQYGSQNNTIIGNVFTDISASGVTLGDTTDPEPSDVGAGSNEINSGNQVLDNYIHDMPVEYQGGAGILSFYEQNLLISHNQIFNTPYSGISNGWGWGSTDTTPNVAQNNQITDNLVYNVMGVLNDGGGIYDLGSQGTSLSNGLQISGNIVHDQQHEYNAIYTDGGSQYITIQNNGLYNDPNDWGGCNPVGNMLFQNNYWQDSAPAWGCGQPTNVTIQNNTHISDGSQLPSSLVNTAGLESAYQDIAGSGSGIPTSGLILQLKANAGVTLNGSTVSQWADQSGNNNNFGQSTSSAQPTVVSNDINGYPALHFDGATTYLQTSGVLTAASQYAMFVVSTLGSADGPFYNGATGTNGFGFYRQQSGNYGLLYGGSAFVNFGSTGATGFQTLEAEDSGNSTNFYVNGTQSGGTSTASYNPASGNPAVVGGINGSQLWSGDIAEVIVYNRALSTSERQQVEQYLSNKYFPTIPTNGLVLQLKADTGVALNGSTVSQWADQSGNNNNFGQSTSSAQPTVVSNDINGYPALHFDGATTYLQTNGVLTAASQYTMFVVSTLGSADGPFYNGGTGTNGFGFYRQQSGNYGLLYGGSAFVNFGSTGATGFQTLEAEDSGNSTNFYVNGTQSGGTSTASYSSASGYPSTVGGINASQLWSGDIAEVIVYNRALSTSERQQVEQYLLTKYGL